MRVGAHKPGIWAKLKNSKPYRFGKISLRKDHAIILILVCILGYLGISKIPKLVTTGVQAWAYEHGYRENLSDRDLIPSVFDALAKNDLTDFSTSLPELILDIKFKNFEKIRDKRDTALRRGYLLKEDRIFVPAKIRLNSKTTKVKVRLKGDGNDHRDHPNKWSLKVNVKGKSAVFGMRKFTIQHPKVRGYQSEPLVMLNFRNLGILTPRYFFARVIINGEDIGVMAIEESFSKELLESQGRRENVILKFDEDLLWSTNIQDGDFRGTPFFSYKNAHIDVYGRKKTFSDPSLAKGHSLSAGLLRAFVEGKIAASEVFDIELVAKFLAGIEIWGNWHSANWRNIRFYFNPITSKLEPILYDISMANRIRGNTILSVSGGQHLLAAMLEDPLILSRFLFYKDQLATAMSTGVTYAELSPYEADLRKALQSEFYLLNEFSWEQITERSKFLLTQPDTAFDPTDIHSNFKKKKLNGDYPILAHAHVTNSNSSPVLELSNAVSEDIQIGSMVWRNPDTLETLPFTPKSKRNFPILMEGTELRQLPEITEIPFIKDTAPSGYELIVSASTAANENRIIETIAEPYPTSVISNPMPKGDVAEQLSRHSFLTYDKELKVLSIKIGVWEVTENLVIPKDMKLVARGGTTLLFKENTQLISHSPVIFKGSDVEPIILKGKVDGSVRKLWNGVAVLSAGSPSTWQNVLIEDTSGVVIGDWELTGCVTFYDSEVAISSSVFRSCEGEDALNIVQSKYIFDGLVFENVKSDAIDTDFSNGSISNSLFQNIGIAGGGDAFDMSGSVASISDTTFINIGDKAISVGEKSTVKISNVLVEGATTGLASKDGSIATIENSTFRDLKLAPLMAYVKKPEYGPSKITANNITVTGNATSFLSAVDNQIFVDGNEVPQQKIDIDKLYDTVMKKSVQ